MVSASYADPRLAAVYDALNPPGPDTGFYLGLAGQPGEPARILDLGCGTGALACELAARGHQVTGADPAAAMLAVARVRPGGGRVRWIEADSAGLPAGDRFDLIVMTGHVFQIFTGDREVRALLTDLRQHLAPGGRLAFETRNPDVREWAHWSPQETRRQVRTGEVTADVHYDIRSVLGELVTYETCFRFAGQDGSGDQDGQDAIVIPETLRFMSQEQVADFLAEAGYGPVTWYGDWDRSPVSPQSPEIIAVANNL